MMNRKTLLCSLVLLLTVFSGVASAYAPYASIVAFNAQVSNQGGRGYRSQPNVSTLGVLDIVNMTPWDISIGPGDGDPMLLGLTQREKDFGGFWIGGFNKQSKGKGAGGFAFHTYQVALQNLLSGWVLQKEMTGLYSQPLWYETIPIVVNSNTFSQGGKTANLNFSVTSTTGFDEAYNLFNSANFPATALSFGDGTNSYGWQTNDTMIYAGGNWQNTTHFLTIQGLGSNANSWKPIVQNLGGIINQSGVKGPVYLNVSGLAYKNFSAVAGDSAELDLVVIIQAGGYSDMQLLFLAVPSSNDGFLKGL